MSGLSDYVNSLNREGWSLRRISQEAERHGHKIDHTTVRKYVNGTHGEPSAEALAALAAAFRVGVNELRAAARRPSVGAPLDLGPESGRLTGPQREAIRHVVRVMLEQNHSLADHAQPDGVTHGERRRPLSRDEQTIVESLESAEHGELELTRHDFDRAADDSGPSLLEADDARAAVRGEETQDPGSDEPA